MQRGCCKLTLEVQEDNMRARTLYESFGFADFLVGDSAATVMPLATRSAGGATRGRKDSEDS